ncbi:hypothetical protein GX50_01391 [[Emmonsia] crescens]|uniref:Uncharacterized protein n=1 Tax=[Emmonsia] crescens TaxID=73230 RepID=A0A2B7ZSR8_9EURO|nr:hypothetical protein GX50_01391 [Emmonsia crescens]
MRKIWKSAALCASIGLLTIGLPATVLAEEDPKYSPLSNFRPGNVTDLGLLYAWVGSYYNGTTEIELTPKIGQTVNDTVCPAHQNRTTTLKWDSLLLITEPGIYNSGSNPVNLWLILFPPNYSKPDMPWLNFHLPSPLMFPIVSSLPKWWNQQDQIVSDYLDMTVTKSPNSTFTIAGTLKPKKNPADKNPYWPVHIDMPPCNSTKEYGNWSMQVHQLTRWNTEGWSDFALPNMTAIFDSKTVNLTIDGTYSATPFARIKDSLWSERGSLSNNDQIQGIIQIRLNGVLDAYRSDVLDVNSTAQYPEWLRTVGFGNNTANIGDSNGGRSVRAALWSPTLIIPFLVAIMI